MRSPVVAYVVIISSFSPFCMAQEVVRDSNTAEVVRFLSAQNGRMAAALL